MGIIIKVKLTILKRASAMFSGLKTSPGTSSFKSFPVTEDCRGFLTSLLGKSATNLQIEKASYAYI